MPDQQWTEAIERSHAEEQRIKDYFHSVFPGFTSNGSGFKGERFGQRFGRRTWTIEYFQHHAEWKAGLYIAEQVTRQNYFWEIASGSTPEQAIDRLKLRIQALQSELQQIGGIE